jgi:hypothetical protein
MSLYTLSASCYAIYCKVRLTGLRHAVNNVDAVSAVGSFMSLKWILAHGVQFGLFCQVQGASMYRPYCSSRLMICIIAAIKQFSDVGQAVW